MSQPGKKRRLSKDEINIPLQFRQPIAPLTPTKEGGSSRGGKRRNTSADRHHHNTITKPATSTSGVLPVVRRDRPPVDTHTHRQGGTGRPTTRTTAQASHIRRGNGPRSASPTGSDSTIDLIQSSRESTPAPQQVDYISSDPPGLPMPALEQPTGESAAALPLPPSPVRVSRTPSSAPRHSVSRPSTAYPDVRASSESSLSALDKRLQQRLAKPRHKVVGRPHARRNATPPRRRRASHGDLIKFEKDYGIGRSQLSPGTQARMDAATRAGGSRRAGRRPIEQPVSGGSQDDEKQQEVEPHYPPIAQSFDRVTQQFHQAHTLRKHHASTLGHKAIHAIPPHERSRFSLGQTKHRGSYGMHSATPALSVNTIGSGHFLIRARRGVTKGIRHQVLHLLRRAPSAFFVNGHKHNKKQAYTIIMDLLRQNKTVEVRLR